MQIAVWNLMAIRVVSSLHTTDEKMAFFIIMKKYALYVLREKDYYYIKSFEPIRLTTDIEEAKRFTLDEAERTIYLYGLGDRYIIEEY